MTSARLLLSILLAAGGSLAAGPGCGGGGAKGKEDPGTALLERCASARGGRASLEALASAQVSATVLHFDPEGKTSNGAEAFDLFLRFPDRARFSFSVGRSNRIALLRGDEGEERGEASRSFVPLEGERLLVWQKSRLLHVVAARFPALPAPLAIAAQAGAPRVTDEVFALRVEIDSGSGLPSVLRFEGDEESFSFGDWRASAGGALLPYLLRCEAGGNPRWEERVRFWQANPKLLDRLFDAPEAPNAGSDPPLEEPRIRSERAFDLVAATNVRDLGKVAEAVASIRVGALAEAKVLLFLDRDRRPVEAALVPTSTGARSVRSMPEARVAEVFVRGTLESALSWVERLESFAREKGHEPAGGVRLMREPEEWGALDEDEGVYRIVLPLRPE
ncbi:MAG TPA: hypothetical protein VFI25_18165 [Planctomycetota bacterium]|nr:hypothetical protein [Planctomycetota bacterium]